MTTSAGSRTVRRKRGSDTSLGIRLRENGLHAFCFALRVFVFEVLVDKYFGLIPSATGSHLIALAMGDRERHRLLTVERSHPTRAVPIPRRSFCVPGTVAAGIGTLKSDAMGPRFSLYR